MPGDAADAGLGPGREFDLIRGFLRARSPRGSSHVLVGPGDDAAVVDGNGIVLSVDLSIEDVHFRRKWMAPSEIGFRAASAALSDLAAMAANPIGILVSLATTAEDAPLFATELMAGITESAHACGADLIGGDLSRSPGPVVVDVVVVGETAKPILRRGARVGDELWVTGELGAAALGIELLEKGEDPDPEVFASVARPTPRIGPARWLASRGLPAAMIDLSDGLGKDAGHLAAASGVRIVLDAARVPVHAALPPRYSVEGAVRLALSGGEDYELCFAARPGAVGPQVAAFEAEFGIPLTRVGIVEEGVGVSVVFEGGPPQPFAAEGFQHFGAGS